MINKLQCYTFYFHICSQIFSPLIYIYLFFSKHDKTFTVLLTSKSNDAYRVNLIYSERQKDRERRAREGWVSGAHHHLQQSPGMDYIGHQNLIRVPCIGKVIKDVRLGPKVEYN